MRMTHKTWIALSAYMRYMRVVMLFFVGLFTCIWFTAGAFAAPLTVDLSRIDASEFPVINCYFSAIDQNGKSLSGLRNENIAILEESAPVTDFQYISMLPGKESIAVILILDHSGSMRGKPLSAAKDAAIDFEQHLSVNDKVALIAFGSKVDTVTELSTDRDNVRDTINALKPVGETALYDAIHQATENLTQCTADRKAIVVLTDGQDNASGSNADECADAAKQNGINIFGIGLGHSINSEALTSLAETTGGRSYFTNSPSELTSIYRAIAQQLQYQYKLTFNSPLPKEAAIWRTVNISVHDDTGDGSGQRQYLAPAPANTISATTMPTPYIWWGVALFVFFDIVLLGYMLWRKRNRIA